MAHFLWAFTEPEIANRTRYTLSGVAAAGAAVLVASVVLPQDAPIRSTLLPAAQSSFAYLLLGLGSRFVVQHHRSRLQIIVLLGVVAAVEIARYRRGQGVPRAATWFAGSLAVCVGVVAAKWALEPGALSDALGLRKSSI